MDDQNWPLIKKIFIEKVVPSTFEIYEFEKSSWFYSIVVSGD